MNESRSVALRAINSAVLFIPAVNAGEYSELVEIVKERVDQVRVEFSLDDREPSIYLPAEDKLHVGYAVLRSLFALQGQIPDSKYGCTAI